MKGFDFVLNGTLVHVDGPSTHMSLLQFLRATGRTGTKEGCAEGDCGACTVAIVEWNSRNERTYRAINSCIALLPMFAGREVVTVEALAEGGELHPVQRAMVKHYGSQCGFCTPGFVMSMFEGYYREDLGLNEQIGDQLNGNLCRCTGYRPIRDAMVEAITEKPADREDLFQLRLKKHVDRALPRIDYEVAGERFVRPTTLPELLEIKARFPGAELVGGATEIGVYINKRAQRFPLLVSTEAVSDLLQIKVEGDAWHIGGAATLTAMEEAFAGEFPCLDKMLWAFASRQIRSRATLAGNLVTASPIGDMAPSLLALDASVVLASTRGIRSMPLDQFFLGYRRTAIEKDEILERVILPRKPEAAGVRRVSETYKVSKRRELDISIVAAAFSIDLGEDNVVKAARFGFGGVAALPVRARKTEAAIVGKPWTRATIDAALPVLREEFNPIDDVRSGAAYRKDLVASLLEKFFVGEKSGAQDEPLRFLPSVPTETSDASRALHHDSAKGHVTGAALYVDDQARRRPMLEIWPVTSPHAHARIVSIDVSEALAIPGVRLVLTANDVPGTNDCGAVRHDETLFADGEVHFHGHVVAIVVGESVHVSRLAAGRVKVVYEPLHAIVGMDTAIAQESFHTTPHVITRGNVDEVLEASAHRLEGSLTIGGQEHFYLEAQAAWAEVGDDGDVFVCSSTQHPSEVQAIVSHVLHLDRSKVVVQAPRMGGGFGGKETQGAAWASYVALAAWKTGKPVRTQLDRDVDVQLTGKRHPFFASYEVAFDAEGRLQAAKVDLFNDGGWALDLSESILDRGLFHLDNAYYVPNVRFTGRVLKTNTVSNTAFRGFGGPQGMVVIEEILDRVARHLDLAPEVVRERNLYSGSGDSNTTHYGQELGDNRIPAIWKDLLKSSKFEERRAAVRKWNGEHTKVKRGVAITPVKFGISFTASFLNQAGALLLVYRDGSVQLNHGGTEMGQGLHAKVIGVAMRELGIGLEKIRAMKTQTDKVPNTSATAASAGSDLNGQAVKAACETIRERLAPIAAKIIAERDGRAVSPASMIFANGAVGDATGNVRFEDVVERAYLEQVSLSASGFYRTPGIGYVKSEGKGRPFYYFAYGAAVTEVEVDGYSGMKRVVRVDILQDVGDSLNPGVDRGQIEGAFVQGMGWLTGEELKWDPSGRLLSHSASTYQIPSIGDAPAEMNVELLQEAHQQGVIHGSKAVGEPPLMLAISVREALRDAVSAFGPKGGEVSLACPSTHEGLLAAIRKRQRMAGGDVVTASAAAEE